VAAHGDPQDWIYHLALEGEWREAAERGGPYGRSTLGKSQAEVGFIHCSFARQVEATARLIYGGRKDVVLLVIDPSAVHAEIRIENLDGGGERFPHIYGELPAAAVVRVAAIPWREDGTRDFDGLI
jgi:glutathione S-transferase